MNGKMTDLQARAGLDESWARPNLIVDYGWILTQPQMRKSLWSDPEAVKSMEYAAESLASTYLAANLNYRNTPLKEFMDSFEKKILLACLRLTQGHQKNAAAILGLKTTALFEKMRKHCINSRQIKLSARLVEERPRMMK